MAPISHTTMITRKSSSFCWLRRRNFATFGAYRRSIHPARDAFPIKNRGGLFNINKVSAALRAACAARVTPRFAFREACPNQRVEPNAASCGCKLRLALFPPRRLTRDVRQEFNISPSRSPPGNAGGGHSGRRGALGHLPSLDAKPAPRQVPLHRRNFWGGSRPRCRRTAPVSERPHQIWLH